MYVYIFGVMVRRIKVLGGCRRVLKEEVKRARGNKNGGGGKAQRRTVAIIPRDPSHAVH
jgi:hypothetical protein